MAPHYTQWTILTLLYVAWLKFWSSSELRVRLAPLNRFKPSKKNILLTVPRRHFFCGSFMFLFCLVFAMSLCASVYMCFVVTCWKRADLLALMCGVFCEFVTFPLVSWVRCGTWLYRFLIFAPLLTSIGLKRDNMQCLLMSITKQALKL